MDSPTAPVLSAYLIISRIHAVRCFVCRQMAEMFTHLSYSWMGEYLSTFLWETHSKLAGAFTTADISIRSRVNY